MDLKWKLLTEKLPRDGPADMRDAGVREGGQASVPDLHQAGDQGILLLLTGTNWFTRIQFQIPLFSMKT